MEAHHGKEAHHDEEVRRDKEGHHDEKDLDEEGLLHHHRTEMYQDPGRLIHHPPKSNNQKLVIQ